MSHQFDCVVDTTPMAKEVSTVRKHVDATTTAVVGMQTAVVIAQKKGADQVCSKVNQGFYALIHSQISQKMAALQSKVDAQLMRLHQQSKQLASIRGRMERDYQMISARYAKLFGGLNRNLRQRITELDRPIIQFASVETDKVSNRSTQLVSVVPIGQAESIKTSQKVVSSSVKYRASTAIKSIKSFIADSNRLQMITDRILLKRPMKSEAATVTVPVCIMESNFDNSGNVQTQSYIAGLNLPESSKSAIKSTIDKAQRAGELTWQQQSSVNPDIVNSFRQMVSASNLDARRQKTILELFEKQGFETL